VCFFETEHLLAETDQVGRERIERRSGHAAAVVVWCRPRSPNLSLKICGPPARSEIFPNVCNGELMYWAVPAGRLSGPFAMGHKFKSEVTSLAHAARALDPAGPHPEPSGTNVPCARRHREQTPRSSGANSGGILHSSRRRRSCLCELARPSNRRTGFSGTEEPNPGQNSSVHRGHCCEDTQRLSRAIVLSRPE